MSENGFSSDSNSGENSDNYGGGEDMPTVTTLLDRRKLRAPTASPVSTAVTPASAPKIKTSPRAAERRRGHRLELWTPDILAQSSAPELKAVELLFSHQVEWILLLLKRETEDVFDARGVSGASRERWALWTGLSLGQETVPELWGDLFRTDAFALRATDPKQATLRNSLGVLPEESSWIFGVGPRTSPLALLLAGGRNVSLQPDMIRSVVEKLRY